MSLRFCEKGNTASMSWAGMQQQVNYIGNKENIWCGENILLLYCDGKGWKRSLPNIQCLHMSKPWVAPSHLSPSLLGRCHQHLSDHLPPHQAHLIMQLQPAGLPVATSAIHQSYMGSLDCANGQCDKSTCTFKSIVKWKSSSE